MNETNQAELEERIQSLVDGHLDDEQRMALLHWIDEEAPAAWRSVALGYVETEALRSAFRAQDDAAASKKVSPFPAKTSSQHRVVTVLVAAVAMILGVFLGGGFRQFSDPATTEAPLIAEVSPAEAPAPVPPSFQAIESLDLALRDRGLQPVISKAIYQAELPDGRTLLVPIQRLTVQP
ncbi:MAG: hypothetical protein P1U85_15450 [Verrucomicrobiales bacterium]|nr:hypothetical protein [Verrucomicrobiales bacterium]